VIFPFTTRYLPANARAFFKVISPFEEIRNPYQSTSRLDRESELDDSTNLAHWYT